MLWLLRYRHLIPADLPLFSHFMSAVPYFPSGEDDDLWEYSDAGFVMLDTLDAHTIPSYMVDWLVQFQAAFFKRLGTSECAYLLSLHFNTPAAVYWYNNLSPTTFLSWDTLKAAMLHQWPHLNPPAAFLGPLLPATTLLTPSLPPSLPPSQPTQFVGERGPTVEERARDVRICEGGIGGGAPVAPAIGEGLGGLPPGLGGAPPGLGEGLGKASGALAGPIPPGGTTVGMVKAAPLPQPLFSVASAHQACCSVQHAISALHAEFPHLFIRRLERRLTPLEHAQQAVDTVHAALEEARKRVKSQKMRRKWYSWRKRRRVKPVPVPVPPSTSPPTHLPMRVCSILRSPDKFFSPLFDAPGSVAYMGGEHGVGNGDGVGMMKGRSRRGYG